VCCRVKNVRDYRRLRQNIGIHVTKKCRSVHEGSKNGQRAADKKRNSTFQDN
jgi:hypothetical protein